MSVWVRSRLGQAALAVGFLAVAMLVASFFVRSMEARAWVYTVAFAVVAVGVALAAGERLHERHERLAFRPQTGLGWWAVGLAAAGVGVMFVSGMLVSVLPPTGEGFSVPRFAFTIAGFASMVAAGVVGVLAWFRRSERSWLVLLTLLPALFAVYFLGGELAFPH